MVVLQQNYIDIGQNFTNENIEQQQVIPLIILYRDFVDKLPIADVHKEKLYDVYFNIQVDHHKGKRRSNIDLWFRAAYTHGECNNYGKNSFLKTERRIYDRKSDLSSTSLLRLRELNPDQNITSKECLHRIHIYNKEGGTTPSLRKEIEQQGWISCVMSKQMLPIDESTIRSAFSSIMDIELERLECCSLEYIFDEILYHSEIFNDAPLNILKKCYPKDLWDEFTEFVRLITKKLILYSILHNRCLHYLLFWLYGISLGIIHLIRLILIMLIFTITEIFSSGLDPPSFLLFFSDFYPSSLPTKKKIRKV